MPRDDMGSKLQVASPTEIQSGPAASCIRLVIAETMLGDANPSESPILADV
jgi:hypothetical protein